MENIPDVPDDSSGGDELSIPVNGPAGHLLARQYLTERDVYQDFLDFVVEATSSEVGYLHLYDEHAQDIALNAWSTNVYGGCTTSTLSHYPLKEAGIWADAIRQRRTVVHNDYAGYPSKKGLPDGHFALHRHMSTPVFWKSGIVAIIGVGNKIAPYSDADVAHIERLAKLGWPIVRDRLHEHHVRNTSRQRVLRGKDLSEVMVAMVGTLSKALELRDEYTSHHQHNVAILSEAIARKLGLPEQQVFGVRLGAIVHDIGKIAIPAEILSKPGRLNAAELAMVRSHAALGAEIFRDVELPWPILDVIEQHHERMDGSGYPKGLVGSAICIEARIVAVADTFDAMASDRPYRHAPGRAAAVEVIMAGRGVTYDAYVVDAFLSVLADQPVMIEDLYGPAR